MVKKNEAKIKEFGLNRRLKKCENLEQNYLHELLRKNGLNKILFIQNIEKSHFVGTAHRNKFIPDFDCVIFDIVNFVDGDNIRFVYSNKFLWV